MTGVILGLHKNRVHPQDFVVLKRLTPSDQGLFEQFNDYVGRQEANVLDKIHEDYQLLLSVWAAPPLTPMKITVEQGALKAGGMRCGTTVLDDCPFAVATRLVRLRAIIRKR